MKFLTYVVFFAILAFCGVCRAQEYPYFVAYSHAQEEPGNLELNLSTASGRPGQGPGGRFYGTALELEYGVRAWWTTEFYLEGVSDSQDSTVFTGFRTEHRFRPLLREHWINPVLYLEFEDINGANKSLREVVGHDGAVDLVGLNAETRREKKRELELKLILGSNFHGWNMSENFIAEKNLINSPWEFGYAVGASRPLKLAASGHRCFLCAEKFIAGVEAYGGLGDRYHFGLQDTSHYLGPSVNWQAPGGATLSFSPQFGLTDFSTPRIYRFGVSYEIQQVGDGIASFFGHGAKP